MKAVESKAVKPLLPPLTLDEPKPIPRGKVSFEEFLEWSDEDILAEWVDGEIILMSPATSKHQQIGSFLEAILRIYTEINHLGSVYRQPFIMRLLLVPSGREPDLLYIAPKHLYRIEETFLNGPADVAVEVVSKESIDRDYNKKFTEYRLGGVSEYWLINPLKSEAAFYHLTDFAEYEPMPLENGAIFRSREIDGFWLRVNQLWQMPLPDTFATLQELMPEMQTEALREAEMKYQQEVAARRSAERHARQEAIARRSAEQHAQQEAIARQQEATARQQAEQQLQSAEQRAQQAEAELAQLRAELETRRNRPENHHTNS